MHIKEALLWVVAALVQPIACEFLVTLCAVELYHAREQLPEQVLPWDLLGTETQHEFV